MRVKTIVRQSHHKYGLAQNIDNKSADNMNNKESAHGRELGHVPLNLMC